MSFAIDIDSPAIKRSDAMSRHLALPLVLVVLAAAAAPALSQDKPSPAQGKKEGVIVKAPGSYTHDVALSPDGKILARAGTGKAELWDVASGKQLHTLKGQPHFYKVAFSPDGKTLG